MDLYKKLMSKEAGKGGLHCPCCNPYKGKYKFKLNKLARVRLNRRVSEWFKELDC